MAMATTRTLLSLIAILSVGCGHSVETAEDIGEITVPVDPTVPDIIPQGECISICGVKVYGMTECEEFQAAENALLKSFTSVDFSVGDDTQNHDKETICQAMSGLKVYFVSDETSFTRVNAESFGLYWETENVVWLAPGMTVFHKVFPHEIGHALDHALTDNLASLDHFDWAGRRFDWAFNVYLSLAGNI